MSIYIVTTLQQWGSLMYSAMDSFGWFSCVFFVFIVCLLPYLSINLVLAVIFYSYRQCDIEVANTARSMLSTHQMRARAAASWNDAVASAGGPKETGMAETAVVRSTLDRVRKKLKALIRNDSQFDKATRERAREAERKRQTEEALQAELDLGEATTAVSYEEQRIEDKWAYLNSKPAFFGTARWLVDTQAYTIAVLAAVMASAMHARASAVILSAE